MVVSKDNETNLKKQSQFLTVSNERKNIYYNKIREIYWFGHLVKTNPIEPKQTQYYLAPRFSGGFEKTKPIFERAK